MMGVRMIATKHMTYGTRRLTAGDDIHDVSGPNARLLTALGRARQVEDGASRADLTSAIQHDARDDLRAEYQRVLGKRPFNGWNADELRERIASAGKA